MITEDYCSFEVAKLLKEKGFDAECRAAYTNYGKLFTTQIQQYVTNVLCSKGYLWDCVAPTHQMAMKWIRETYDIFIVIRRGLTGTGWVYSHEIYKDSQCWYARYGASYDTYEEAVEAALKYTLENLI